MSVDPLQETLVPLTSRAELLEYFAPPKGAARALRVGLEHEKLLFIKGTTQSAPYEGPHGVGAVFRALEAKGWVPFRERPGGPTIAMTRGGASLSFEPGGQFEFSGAPQATARAADAEHRNHVAELLPVLDSLGLEVAWLGYRPDERIEDVPWMPKQRYGIMRRTLSGPMAHAMMKMTATGQVSLDWTDEADLVRKFTATARLAPLLVAWFANSRRVESKDSGYASFRSHVWSGVDPARCGYQPFFLDGTFSLERYVDWALEAPMLFLRRAGEYRDTGLTFRGFLEQGHQGERATAQDWSDHLSTLFPEVRIKKILEVRSADGNALERTSALVALMRGLLYGEEGPQQLMALLPWAGTAAHLDGHHSAQRHGLDGALAGQSYRALAARVLALAERLLGQLDAADAPLLAPLRDGL